MCGIAGVFSAADSRTLVGRMSDQLQHRGPDDHGQFDLTNSAGRLRGTFGHRRLAILDLTSAGHQPMCSPDGRYAITYNGEIYNFPELKRELEAEGAAFTSHCDTEAIVLGWALHGSRFLSKLRGMFALAVWDRSLERGYLARDAFGIKPLYVAQRNGSILFASEVRALVASGLVEPILSAEGVSSFLHTGSVAEPFTIVEGVSAVTPGTLVEVRFDRDVPRTERAVTFARAFPEDVDEVTSIAQSAFQLRNALRDSVRHHLLSDVPAAMFLSGGLDSSALVGIASEVSEKPLETFTVTFAEAEYSEGELGRQVARRFDTNHHEVRLSGRDLLAALPSAFGAMDQPSLDGLNTYIVSRAVRSVGIKVALSGLGGDELFGGYPSFRRASRISPLWRMPSALRGIPALATHRSRGITAEKLRLLVRSDAPAHGAYRASRMLFGDRQVASLLFDSAASEAWSWEVPSLVLPGMSLLRQVSVEELCGYMRNTLLRDSDVFSMAHSLELRVPFLDPAVVRVAARAADRSKLGRTGPKPLLVRAVEDLIPPDLLARPKRGFTLPFESWMRTDLSAELDSMFAGKEAERSGLSSPAAREVWESFRQNRGHFTWSRPWALYTLMRWVSENDFSYPVAARDHVRTRAMAGA